MAHGQAPARTLEAATWEEFGHLWPDPLVNGWLEYTGISSMMSIFQYILATSIVD